MYLYSRRKFIIDTSLLSVGGLFINSLCFLEKNISTLKFGIVTDTHYANRRAKNNRFYSNSIHKLRYAIDFFNTENLDFIIHLGDLKDQDEVPNKDSTLSYLKDIEKEFTKFKGKKYHVLGNHDMDSISKTQFIENIQNSGFNIAKSYYHVDLKGYRLIILDANFSSDGSSYSNCDFNWKDANLPKRQLDWLNTTLNSTGNPCLVFIHHPIDNLKDDYYAVQNSSAIRTIIENSKKVIAVFQGHRHQESYININGIHYYTFNAMVDYEGLENNSFAIASINLKKGIQIDGYFRMSNFKHNIPPKS